MNWLLDNSAVALVLALVVMLVGCTVRPAPAVMHVLWLFVLLKLVTPPLLEVPLWAAPVAPVATAPKPTPIVQDPTPGVAADRIGPELPGRASEAMAAAARSSRQPDAATAAWSLGTALMVGWAVGSSLFVMWLAIGILRARRRLLRLPQAPQWLRREVEHLAAQLGVHVPELLDDARAGSPCVWSLGRVRLLLPAHELAALSRKGRSTVLVHELAHLRRGDHWVAHLELALAALLWWHPLFWFARARLRLWAELACDAWAIASVPDATLDYATVLVDAVARPDSAVPGMTVLAARPAARAAFERRLQMILNENVPCRASRGWWLPFATLGVGLFAVPVAAQRESQDPVRIEIKVNGRDVTGLSEAEREAVIAKLKQQAKAVDPARQEPAPKKLAKKRAVVDPADPEAGDMQHEIQKALAEAKLEIANDEGLRELGLTGDVEKLIQRIGAGKDVGDEVSTFVQKATKGAKNLVVKEIRGDADLRELGLTGDVESLVGKLLDGANCDAELDHLIKKAMGSAMHKVTTELRNDPDLKELGLSEDIQGLVEKAMRGALQGMKAGKKGGSFDFDFDFDSDFDSHFDMKSDSAKSEDHQSSSKKDHQESHDGQNHADSGKAKDPTRAENKSGTKGSGKKKADKKNEKTEKTEKTEKSEKKAKEPLLGAFVSH